MISIITLIIVFVLIAVRQVGNIRLRLWQIMLLGALAVLVSGEISPGRALEAINADVMLFLFGVFVIGQALEDSGYLGHLAYRLFRRARTLNGLILLVIFGMGLLSALLMNDTLAIIGTPVVLSLASRADTQPRVLLLSLAFAVTIGSVMSPIGNPQNLLIAIHGGVANPFVTFLRFLLAPTLVNLFLAYLLLRLFYRRHLHGRPLAHAIEPIKDARLAGLSRISLVILVVLIIAKIVTVLAGLEIDFKLTYIALAAALPVIVFIPRRPGLLRRLDWFTLIFFAAMFVLMQSVWDAGIFQSALAATNLDLTATGVILGVSVLLSQLLSNVPLVALYLPVLVQIGASARDMMALAAGSTIAGNLTLLGAASNIIIIQNAEKRGGATLSFWDFVRVGAPLTVINIAVYWLFLAIL
ncbi:MAG: anion transporter [Chloroflexi bacterium RBG_16_60_22]|nr:MAG: anion transporter [Chloroflexi bacterium RBG_16_60_22]